MGPGAPASTFYTVYLPCAVHALMDYFGIPIVFSGRVRPHNALLPAAGAPEHRVFAVIVPFRILRYDRNIFNSLSCSVHRPVLGSLVEMFRTRPKKSRYVDT